MNMAVLGEVCEITMGQAPKGDTYNDRGDGIPLVAGAGDFGELYPQPKKFTTAEGVRISEVGDVIVGIRASIGDKVLSDGRYCLGRGVAGFRAGPRVDQRYLWNWVTHAAPALAAKGRGATFLQVNKRDVAEMEIPLPPIEEQRRIAAVLDAADALRAKRRQAIAKLDSLSQAIFINMFGDPVSNERRWPEFQLSEICTKIQIGPFGSLLHQSDYVAGGVPLVNPMHLIDGQIQPQLDQTVGEDKYAKLQQYQLERGDVVMARRGEMGRVAIVDAEADGYLCGSGSLYFRPDTEQVIPEFLAAALSSPRGRRELENSSLGVTMPNLNSTIVEQFGLGLPPIELQRSFSTALQERSRMHQLQWGQSGVLDALFGSLQQRAFRGVL